jgi:hypothetical protein
MTDLEAGQDRAAQDEAEADEFVGAVCAPEGTCAVPGVQRTPEHGGLAPRGSLG